ncbi:F-box/FBD/LRR-repeat protein At1g78750-like [Pyrus communis]|uniref:F-box/FBD/LRR-repeat protein At1g78750-like n=1 Tax=Pyrus communis TaxID=23211 RepID=UPI0035BFF379
MVICRIFAGLTFWFRSFFAPVKLLLDQTEPNHAVVVRQTDGPAAVERDGTDSCPTLELTVTAERSEGKDWINELPDCILSSIFSLLTLKDAVDASSLVCRRGRYLGTLLPILTRANHTFDVPNIFGVGLPKRMDKLPEDGFNDRRPSLINVYYQRESFVKCVNKVLKLHHGDKLDSFKVEFFLDRFSAAFLDEWIRLAITKGVEVIHLHLYRCSDWEQTYNYYVFPSWLLSELKAASNLKNLSMARCVLRLPPGFDGFNQLTSLYLCKIADEIPVARLLSDCLLLESLTLKSCKLGRDLIIESPSHRLNDLKLVNCKCLETVYISLVNLASLELFQMRAAFRVWELPTFRSLKKLELDIFSNEPDLVWVLNFLNAAPLLEELVVTEVSRFGKEQQDIENFAGIKHCHLREVKFQGFQYTPCEIELAICILRNAIMLKKMVIDPYGKYHDGAGVWVEALYYESNSLWKEKGRALVHEKLKEVMTYAQIIIL